MDKHKLPAVFFQSWPCLVGACKLLFFFPKSLPGRGLSDWFVISHSFLSRNSVMFDLLWDLFWNLKCSCWVREDSKFAELHLSCFECFLSCSFLFWPEVLLLFKINCMQYLLTIHLACGSWGVSWICWIVPFCASSLLCLCWTMTCSAFQIVLDLFWLLFMFLADCNSFCSLAFLIVFMCFCCPLVTWYLSLFSSDFYLKSLVYSSAVLVEFVVKAAKLSYFCLSFLVLCILGALHRA